MQKKVFIGQRRLSLPVANLVNAAVMIPQSSRIGALGYAIKNPTVQSQDTAIDHSMKVSQKPIVELKCVRLDG